MTLPGHETLFLQFMRAATSEAAWRLGAQIFGYAPCPTCDFLASHCQCAATLERERLAIVSGHAVD